MIPTPLTDHAQKHGRKRHSSLMVCASFAQGLERKLTKAKQENRKLKLQLQQSTNPPKTP